MSCRIPRLYFDLMLEDRLRMKTLIIYDLLAYPSTLVSPFYWTHIEYSDHKPEEPTIYHSLAIEQQVRRLAYGRWFWLLFSAFVWILAAESYGDRSKYSRVNPPLSINSSETHLTPFGFALVRRRYFVIRQDFEQCGYWRSLSSCLVVWAIT